MVRERLLTAGQIADYLNCSVSTVRRLAGAAKIPHYRLGKLLRFRRTEVDSWLSQYKFGPKNASLDRPDPPDQLTLFPDLKEHG